MKAEQIVQLKSPLKPDLTSGGYSMTVAIYKRQLESSGYWVKVIRHSKRLLFEPGRSMLLVHPVTNKNIRCGHSMWVHKDDLV